MIRVSSGSINTCMRHAATEPVHLRRKIPHLAGRVEAKLDHSHRLFAADPVGLPQEFVLCDQAPDRWSKNELFEKSVRSTGTPASK